MTPTANTPTTTPSPDLPWAAAVGMRKPRYFATREEADNWAIAQPGGSIVAPAILLAAQIAPTLKPATGKAED